MLGTAIPRIRFVEAIRATLQQPRSSNKKSTLRKKSLI
jgi:hypothetical protein